MDISNEELFNHALSDEVPEVTAEDTAQPQGQDQPRDEHGRFAEKAAEAQARTEATETEQKPDTKPAESKEEAQVPSWRLRELREAREAAERRASDLERQLAQFRQKQPEPQQRPDLFENPDGFVKANVREEIDPITSQLNQMREFYSRTDAEREFGAEKVRAAYEALGDGLKANDPEAVMTYQRAMQSIHPFREIANWHKQREIVSEIGGDPQAWFQKQLEAKLADDKFKAELAAKLNPAPQEKPKPVFNVPPSLNRATASAPTLDEGGDLSNESLFKFATG
jgi:hypothetical protein